MSPTILIVEANDFMRWGLREWLGMNFPGCQVVEATSGEEALAIAWVNLPQIVVIDLSLPGISGLQVTAQIKNMWPTTPVVILSFYDDEVSRVSAITAGATACVSKGKISSELQPVLATLLPPLRPPVEHRPY